MTTLNLNLALAEFDQNPVGLLQALNYDIYEIDGMNKNNFLDLFPTLTHDELALFKQKIYFNNIQDIDLIGFYSALSQSETLELNHQENIIDKLTFWLIQLPNDQIDLHKRSVLSQITREINQKFHTVPAVLFFRYGDFLTMSIVQRRLNKKESSKHVLEQINLIKDIDLKNPHAGHLKILEKIDFNQLFSIEQPKSYIQIHHAWEETLSTELLVKDFYKEIRNWYYWSVDYCQFPKQTNKEEAILRLLSRFMFVWFMKEGGLIPNELFDPKSLHQYLKQNPETNCKESNYYKAIIQNLFFATLNAPLIDEHTGENFRRFIQSDDTQHLDLRYRYANLFEDQQAFLKLMETIPFLNGGLFDAISLDLYHDGFDENLEIQSELKFPNFLFFQKDKTNYNPLNEIFATINKRYDVQGLIYILNRYKFTVTENTSLEQDIALDPELLGRIFEGLLAYFNQETNETTRKTTGSFYTPKEVVDHMVEESLIKYFINYFANEGKNEKSTPNPSFKKEGNITPLLRGEDDALASAGGSKQLAINNSRSHDSTALTSEKMERSPLAPLKRGETLEAINNPDIYVGAGDDTDIGAGSVANDNNLEPKIRILLSEDFVDNPFDKHQSQIIFDAIKQLKIFDPACGSGAFPMGILNKLILMLSRIDADLIDWQRYALDSMLTDLENTAYLKENPTEFKILSDLIRKNYLKIYSKDFGRKLDLIRNVIHAVDIQPIAVQLTKLRFFISLFIEQHNAIKNDDLKKSPKLNYGILPLPNMDSKIICANTLITPQEPKAEPIGQTEEMKFDQEKIDALMLQSNQLKSQHDEFIEKRKDLERHYFSAHSKLQKDSIIQADKDIQMEYLHNLETLKQVTVDLQKCYFDYDNVINDLNQKIQKAKTEASRKKHQKKIDEMDKVLTKIKTDFDRKIELIRWAYYNQYRSSGIFDYKNMFFDVKVGFNIVIGNPPYIRQEKIKHLKPLLQECNYTVFNGTADIYTYFYELSYNILKENGILSFITSNKWFRANYGQQLRELIKNQTKILEIIDFGGKKVFESATVDTHIILLEKSKPDTNHQFKFSEEIIKSRLEINHKAINNPDIHVGADDSIEIDVRGTSVPISKNGICNAVGTEVPPTELNSVNWLNQSDLDTNCFTFGDNATLNLKKKIERIGTPLKNWDIQIYRGVLTGFNEAFIISTEKRDELLAQCETVEERQRTEKIIKPILRGRDIQKYGYEWANLWIIFTRRGIEIDEYPVIKEYLMNFYDQIRPKNNGEKTGRKAGSYQWYEIQDNIAYYKEFDKPKIVWASVGETYFSYIPAGFYILDTNYFFTTTNKYLLGLLNSKLLVNFLNNLDTKVGTVAYRHYKYNMEQLPIPKLIQPVVNQIFNNPDIHVGASSVDIGASSVDGVDDINIAESLFPKPELPNLSLFNDSELPLSNPSPQLELISISNATHVLRGEDDTLASAGGSDKVTLKFNSDQEEQQYHIQQQIIVLVDEILKLKAINNPDIYVGASDSIAELENKIDELVYKLYDLSDAEINLIHKN